MRYRSRAMNGRATSTTSAMPASIGQVAARNRSGGTVVTSVTMRPMNQGTALSVSATNNSTTNRATNSHFAWRAKCQKNAMSPAGGSGCFGESVGRNNVSNRANMIRWRPGALLHGLAAFATRCKAAKSYYDYEPNGVRGGSTGVLKFLF